MTRRTGGLRLEERRGRQNASTRDAHLGTEVSDVLGLLWVILGFSLASARVARGGTGASIAIWLSGGETFRLRWTRDQLDHGPSPPQRRGGTRLAGPPDHGLSTARGPRRPLAPPTGLARRPTRYVAVLA